MGRKEILMNDAFWQRVALLCSVSTSVCIIGADMTEPWPHLLIHLLTWYHPCHIILSSKFSALVLSLVLESSMVAPRHRSQTRLGQTDLVPTMSLVLVSFLSPLKQVTIVAQFQKFQWISSSGFVLEALLTMLLVLVVYATAVDNKVTITMSKIKTLLSL